MRYHRGTSSDMSPRRGGQGLDLGAIQPPSDFDRAACLFFRQFNGVPPRLSLNDFLIRFERAIVFNTLAEMNGCQRRAAAFLKLKNTTLNRKVKVQHIQFVKVPLLPDRDGTGSPKGPPE